MVRLIDRFQFCLLCVTVNKASKTQGGSFGHQTNKATNVRNSRGKRTDEQIQQGNENVRVRMLQLSASQSQEAQ